MSLRFAEKKIGLIRSISPH